MDDARAVRGIERIRDLRAEIEQRVRFEGATDDAMFERLALQQFHSDERPAIVFADFVNRADIRMV